MEKAEYHLKFGYSVIPVQKPVQDGGELQKETIIDENLYTKSEYYPKRIAIMGAPVIIRDFQAVPVEVYPVQYKPATNELKVFSYISLEIHCSGIPQPYPIPSGISSVFKPLYEAATINYEFLQLPDSSFKPGGYLIVTPDEFYDAILPLAEWKNKKGYKTTVAKLSEIGNTATEIKEYISNAYYNWDTAPDCVLLVGDIGTLPSFSHSHPPCPVSDHDYSLLEGNDYFSDVLVGRLSVTTEQQLNTIVSKILGYEMNPYLDSTSWYKRALLIGANYPDVVTTATLTKRWVMDQLLAYGYLEVDTCFYYGAHSSAECVWNSLNRKVSIVNYRGWGRSDGWHYPDFRTDDVYALTPGWELPIVTSIVCGTGNFGVSECFGEAWLRAGSPTNPKGGVAFLGPSHFVTNTRYNNCLDAGIYQGLLNEDLYIFGLSVYRGKIEVYKNLPFYDPDTNTLNPEHYFYTYNILGDPSLWIWTDIPKSLLVNHSPTAPLGHSTFEVEVKDQNERPVEGALVCLWKMDEVYDADLTDPSGKTKFLIAPTIPDTMWVTVTSHNCIPYLGYAVVLPTSYVGYSTHLIDDSLGNGNGEVNPGEDINVQIRLQNYGAEPAPNVVSSLSTSDNFITLIDSVAEYGNIQPGEIAEGSYRFIVASSCTNNHLIPFDLLTRSGDSSWTDMFKVSVSAPDLIFTDYKVFDTDSTLDPGQTLDVAVKLTNRGLTEASQVVGALSSRNPAVTVIEPSGFFGTILPECTSINLNDPFTISADSSVTPGREIELILNLSGDNEFAERISFFVTIGRPEASDPLGPDEYGYYAYDSYDTNYTECPAYEWTEIDPTRGGNGTYVPLGNDETKTISLPFAFTYYGESYEKVSICSNGWLAMDSTWMVDAQNWHMSAALGPPLLIAPFWDELDPSRTDSSGVYYYYDSNNNRFIIEWSRVHQLLCPPGAICSTGAVETFQAVLYDPVHYPTSTGEGEVVFQYFQVENGDSFNCYATVGIRGDSSRLEYSYLNEYPPQASPLESKFAIKFTTDPPDTFPVKIDSDSGSKNPVERWHPKPFALLKISPNPFNKYTEISFLLPTTSMIKIEIFNISGQLVRNLVNGLEGPGIKVFKWDGRNENGKGSPSGIYFLKLKAETSGKKSHTALMKMLLLR